MPRGAALGHNDIGTEHMCWPRLETEDDDGVLTTLDLTTPTAEGDIVHALESARGPSAPTP